MLMRVIQTFIFVMKQMWKKDDVRPLQNTIRTHIK